jgi:hypothetical protein
LYIEVHNIEFAFPNILPGDEFPSPLPACLSDVGIQAEILAEVGTKRKASPQQNKSSQGQAREITPSQQAKLDEKARRDVARAETNSRLAVAQEIFRAAQVAKALTELLNASKPQ